jgi:uncharacterized membrane protein YfcA
MPPALPPGMTMAHYAGMGAIVAIGALLQGIGGLGFAMFAAPAAALFYPELAPAPLLVLASVLSLMAALRERTSIDWPIAGNTLAGRVVGTVLAAAVIATLPQRPLAVLFGLLILAGVAASLAGRHIPPTRANTGLAGLASGLMGTITSAGASPLALVMQELPPARLRATIGCILSVGAVVSLALLAAVGRFGIAELWLGVLLAPCMVAGFLASNGLTRRVPARALRRFLLLLTALGGLGVIAQALL